MDKEIGNSKSKEIDVIGVIKTVLAEKKLLGKFILVSAVLGVIIALCTPKSYTANVVLAPEMSGIGGISESLSDIASMVGINVGGSTGTIDAIYPDIYPDVFSSSDFIVTLFDIKVQKEEDSTKQTYYNYLAYDQKVPFWHYPKIWISKLLPSKKEDSEAKQLNLFDLTKEQSSVCDAIRTNISCIVDKKTNVITIYVTDQDKRVAAIVSDTIQRRLQQYITDYRTKKARFDLQYIQKMYDDARADYNYIKKQYISFSEGNRKPALQSIITRESELENEMQLRFSSLSQLTQQLQLAKSKVQEKTPAFTIIQSASIPKKASSFPRSFTVLLYIFFGIVLDALWVLYLRKYFISKKGK